MTGSRMNSAAEMMHVAGVCILAILAPLAMGCTGEWPRLALEISMGAVVALWALVRPRPLLAAVWPMAIAALPLLQVVPLPDRLLTSLAPVSAGAWKVAHQGDPQLFGRISVDPTATLAAARCLLLACGAIAALADLGRQTHRRRWLAAALAFTSVAVLTLGVLFPVTRENHVLLGFISLDGPLEYWRTPVEPPIRTSGWGYLESLTVGNQRYQHDLSVTGDGFSTYINSNHFAGAVGLTLPFALAWLCTLANGRLPRWVGVAMAAIAWVGGLYVVGIMAQSRAGCAALLLAGLVFFSLLTTRPWPRRLLMGLTLAYAMFLVICVVVLVGQFVGVTELIPEPWRQRFVAALNDGRAIAARVGSRMFLASPLLGTGLGSYDELYRRLMPGATTLYFAHNDYIQLLAETGLVGIGTAVALAGILGRRFLGFLHKPCDADAAICAAAWAAVAAIAAHSAFDFNLQVPANGFLAAVVVGLAAGTAPGRHAAHPRSAAPACPASRLPGAALAVACAFSFGFMVRDTLSDASIRQMQWSLVGDKLGAVPPHDAAAAQRMADALADGERAYRYDPANARVALLIGRLHLHLGEVAILPPAERDAHASEAAAWFMKAQRACAVCPGLPEAISAAPPRASDAR